MASNLTINSFLPTQNDQVKYFFKGQLITGHYYVVLWLSKQISRNDERVAPSPFQYKHVQAVIVLWILKLYRPDEH